MGNYCNYSGCTGQKRKPVHVSMLELKGHIGNKLPANVGLGAAAAVNKAVGAVGDIVNGQAQNGLGIFKRWNPLAGF